MGLVANDKTFVWILYVFKKFEFHHIEVFKNKELANKRRKHLETIDKPGSFLENNGTYYDITKIVVHN